MMPSRLAQTISNPINQTDMLLDLGQKIIDPKYPTAIALEKMIEDLSPSKFDKKLNKFIG